MTDGEAQSGSLGGSRSGGWRRKRSRLWELSEDAAQDGT